jgi:serine/threonine protein kinase
MPAPATTTDFLDVVRKSRLVEESDLTAFAGRHPDLPDDPIQIAAALQADGLLTNFQSEQLLRGKYRGFVLGRFKLMDRIGLGGMGQVFLAEHGMMRKKVALKVLPPDRAQNQFARERFIREARTTGQLEHPNLIKAYDLDRDGDVHFLILEYVDGMSFQDWVARSGPLDPHRAAYYLWQAASGIAYLSGKGLVHRDIKPANLIVDRVGAVKILDLGLVREEDAVDDLTRREDVKFLGTADYLAPEQLANCSTVDVRADLYGLGATGYFLLTGKTPYSGQTMAQKLIAAQTSEARAVHLVNPTVPIELSVIITKLMAKKPADRYQTAEELLAALDPWTESPPDPPAEHEFPNREGHTAPIPNSAVALSFNLMKAARGGSGSGSGSGGTSSHNKLCTQASSSSLRLHSATAADTKVAAELPTTETPSPAMVATPGPVAAPAATPTPAAKPTFAPLAVEPKAPPKPRKAKGPPPLAATVAPPKPAPAAEPPPLVDMETLKKRASAALKVESKRAPIAPIAPPARGFWAFVKRLFGRSSDEALPSIRDSARLG